MKKEHVVFFIPILALLLSLAIYAAVASPFQNFGQQGTRFAGVLESYQEIPEGSILFLGESQIREDVDCHLISEHCYNYGLAGIMPLQIALTKDLIIQAKPEKVVIGITASSFDESINQNPDLFYLLGQHATIPSYLDSRLTEEERKLLTFNKLEYLLHKRKFILPTYLGIIRSIISPQEGKSISRNFKDPHFFTHNQTVEELSAKLKKPEVQQIFKIEKGAKRQREAFVFFISELSKSGVDVVVVQMPLHPFVKETIPLESHELFNEYIQEIATQFPVEVHNLQDEFTAEYFTDLTHLNEQGMTLFSERIARGEYDII